MLLSRVWFVSMKPEVSSFCQSHINTTLIICTRPCRSLSQSHGCQRGWTADGEGQRWPWPTPCSLRVVTCIEPLFSYVTTETIGSPCTSLNWDLHLYQRYTLCYGSFTLLDSDMDSEPNGYIVLLPPANVLCEGYVFTPVCQSFCSQGGDVHSRGCAWREGVRGRGVCVAGRHAWQGVWQGVCMVGGVHGGGACVVGGVWQERCVWQGGVRGRGACMMGGAWQIPRDTVNERAVRILLECILVQNMFTLYRLRLRPPLATSV